MKLTPFGEAARVMRMKYGLSLKTMAEAMKISSPYLSSIEFGEKRLADKHVEAALRFLADHVTKEQLNEVRDAAAKSKDLIDTSDFSSDNRMLMSAFARKLKEGDTPTPAILSWLESTKKGG